MHFEYQTKQTNAFEKFVRKNVTERKCLSKKCHKDCFVKSRYVSLKCFRNLPKQTFFKKWFHLCLLSLNFKLNSTQPRKNSKKIYKSIKRVWVFVLKVYSLLSPECWLLTAWCSGSLEKRLLLSAWLLTFRFCLPSFASFFSYLWQVTSYRKLTATLV